MSLALVDISTRQIHIFPLQEGGKVKIKDFVTSVEKKLTESIAASVEGETDECRVLSVAVGDRCINICDQYRSVRYYLLDAKPWYIKTRAFSSHHVDLYVKEIKNGYGNEAAVKMDLDKEFVKDLKQRFAEMTCAAINAMHLVFDKRELENEKKLLECNLFDGCVVSCILSDRRANFGSPYVHILHDELKNQDNKGIVKPVWRRATPGMWLEGICTNEICVAYSKMVIVNQGFSDLDFINEGYRCKCPMCYEVINPCNCGFSRCEWMTVSSKASPGETDEFIIRQEWQRVSEGYQCIVPNKENWTSFKVICRELNSFKLCMACLSYLPSDEQDIAACGHAYHINCRREREECLQCLGNQTMTSYQKSFL